MYKSDKESCSYTSGIKAWTGTAPFRDSGVKIKKYWRNNYNEKTFSNHDGNGTCIFTIDRLQGHD